MLSPIFKLLTKRLRKGQVSLNQLARIAGLDVILRSNCRGRESLVSQSLGRLSGNGDFLLRRPSVLAILPTASTSSAPSWSSYFSLLLAVGVVVENIKCSKCKF